MKAWVGVFLAVLSTSMMLPYGEEVDDTITAATATATATATAIATASETLTPTPFPMATETIVCDGNLTCPQVYSPVCTSNGRTYSNPCQFKNAYCENPSDTFYIVSNGTCSDDAALRVQSVDDGDNDGITFTKEVFDVPIDIDGVTSPTITDSDGIESPVVADTSVEGSGVGETPAGKSSRNYDCDNGDLACDATNDPVCASNGYTYSNECQFKNAYCESPSESLFIVSKGPCDNKLVPIEVQSTGDVWGVVFDVPVELDEVEVDTAVDVHTDRHKLSAYCTLECPTGAVAIEPICGTDSRSYINPCHLLSSKCEAPELEKQYDGLCIMGHAPSTGGVPSLAVQETSADCNPYCGKDYAPVCGSNGITYGNECLFTFANCQDPRVTRLGNSSCSDLYLGTTHEARGSGPSCVPSVCPGTDAPVCGSDGETYLNACMLNNAKCEIPQLSVVHEGACGRQTRLTCATLTCRRYKRCEDGGGRLRAHCVDVCHADRCGPNEACQLLQSDCVTAPCSPVATCVPKATTAGEGF